MRNQKSQARLNAGWRPPSFDEVTFLLRSLMQRCKERRRDSAHKMANMLFKPKRTPQGCGHSVTDWDFLSAIWEWFLPVSINPLYFSVLDGQAPCGFKQEVMSKQWQFYCCHLRRSSPLVLGCPACASFVCVWYSQKIVLCAWDSGFKLRSTRKQTLLIAQVRQCGH